MSAWTSGAPAHRSTTTEVLAPLHELAPIGLDELNAHAELQTRVDRKYVLPAQALPAVLAALPEASLVLELNGRRALRYASDYFDTPALDSYLGAARGRRRRFKVRSRTYVDSDASFLEVKTRGGRSTTVKDRVPVALTTDGRLDEDGRAYAVETLEDAGIPAAERIGSRLRPRLSTRYRRATLLLPQTEWADASRATIDVDLAWHDVTGAGFLLPGAVIVETKSGHKSGALDRALWRHGHRPTSISKYATGLAAMHPELPANKWRRVLARHFGDAEPLGGADTPAEPAPPLLPATRTACAQTPHEGDPR